MNADHIRSLWAALTLIGVTALAFIAIHVLGESSGVSSALSIVAGLATMAALDFLSRYARSSEREKVDLDLNRDFVIRAITEATAQQLPHRAQPPLPEKPGAVTARHLLSTDPSLALAKLRIDLQEVLLELANAHDGGRPAGIRSLSRVAEELVGTGKLPKNLLYPIKQISDICNLAVHGTEIPSAKAAEVVDIGEALLAALRDIRTTTADVAVAK